MPQRLSDGTYNYTYDAEGNLIRRVKNSNGDQLDLTYDYRNRLDKIVESFGDLNDPVLDIDYRYDSFDRLVWRTQTNYHHTGGGEGGGPGPVTTTVDVERRFYDGDHVVLDFIQHEWTGPIQLEHRYLYGPAVDQVLAQEDVMGQGQNFLTNVRWLLTDNLGTVRDVIDGATGAVVSVNGVVTGHFLYDAYGQILEGDKTLTRYLYTGRDFDIVTGLQYNRARWYDSFTGRWTTQDPTGFAAGDANLYRYVGNSPTNGTDPSGELKWTGSAKISFWGSLVSSDPWLVFNAFTLDDCWFYTIGYEGYLKNGKSGMVGLGYFTFTESFDGLEARAEWPVNAGDKVEVASIGVSVKIGWLTVKLTAQRYTVGDFQWWGAFGSGGINTQVFGGGGTGEIDGRFLRLRKERRL